MAKKPLIEPNQWNSISGNKLIDMGYRKTSDGYLIASNLKYRFWLIPGGNFQIFLNEQENIFKCQKENSPRQVSKRSRH